MPEKKVLLVTCTSLQIQSYTEAVSNTKCKILQIIFVLHTPQNDSLMKWNAKIRMGVAVVNEGILLKHLSGESEKNHEPVTG